MSCTSENNDDNNNGFYLLDTSSASSQRIDSSPPIAASPPIVVTPPPSSSPYTRLPYSPSASRHSLSPDSPSMSNLEREKIRDRLLAKRQFSEPTVYSAIPESSSATVTSSFSSSATVTSSGSSAANQFPSTNSSSSTSGSTPSIERNPVIRYKRSFSDPAKDLSPSPPANSREASGSLSVSVRALVHGPSVNGAPSNNGSPPKRLKCDQCIKSFASVSGWKKHVESKHFGIR